MIAIRALASSDIPIISELHVRYLRTTFAGAPGMKLLSYYYQQVADRVGSCGFVAERNGEIMGFICGVWEPQSLHNSLIRKCWLGVIISTIHLTVSEPQRALRFLSRIRAKENGQDGEGFELRPIVLVPKARGTGVASRLVNALLREARRMGYCKVYLWAEADNVAANRFYRKVGFKPLGGDNHHGNLSTKLEKPLAQAIEQ